MDEMNLQGSIMDRSEDFKRAVAGVEDYRDKIKDASWAMQRVNRIRELIDRFDTPKKRRMLKNAERQLKEYEGRAMLPERTELKY